MTILAIGDIWKALRTALLADTQLTAKLGAVTAMYRSFPQERVKFPILVLTNQGLVPQTDVSGPGLYRPTPQLDIFVDYDDYYAAEEIFGVLEENFSIPNRRTTGITSDNHRITELRWFNLIEVGPLRVVDTNEPIIQFSIDFRLRIQRY